MSSESARADQSCCDSLSVSTRLFEQYYRADEFVQCSAEPLNKAAVDMMATAGIAQVELGAMLCDYRDVEYINHMAAYLASAQVRVRSLHEPFDIEQPQYLGFRDQALRTEWVDRLKHVIDRTSVFAAEYMVVHVGPPGNTDAVRQSLNELIEHCQATDNPLVLAIENSPRAGSTEYLVEILRHADPQRVSVNLDVGHCHAVGEDAVTAIKRLAKRLIGLHLSDNHGSGDEHLLPGEGTINWPHVAAALDPAGFEGMLTYEADHRIERCVHKEVLDRIVKHFKLVFRNSSNSRNTVQ